MSATIYVVRHAKAGRRSDWRGDDRERPLSKGGWRQARAIADRLADRHVTSLASSPYVRCRQTLEPLGERVGLPVLDEPALAEGRGFGDALGLIERAPDGSVLCSHGDVIPDVIDALVRRGMEVTTEPDWRKASLWVLTRNGRGAATHGAAEPPPA